MTSANVLLDDVRWAAVTRELVVGLARGRYCGASGVRAQSRA
ncbi:hypothetical protein U2F26_34150 [Micromonospora sp. 4G57]|uniref:Uncharacterized protein n=1 Tax=Micromonospora sicca TaxID=2202420 RepID=A0ABU5JJ25_9ACTN|nr:MULTISPECIES: hypothetical protein [unclassified Micromonospora]MDZ5447692.1 hypothetical protein [Micromonospora sp. 4G57]MDZ5492628.1 hypothetical protein [Micromonospora sp. 4G53]